MSDIIQSEIFRQIIDACIPVLCLVITAGGAYLVALLRKYTTNLQANIDNDRAGKYMDMACDAVEQAVTYVAQTFVDALKSDNAFTKERQLEAFNTAKNKVLDILGDTAVKYLHEIYGDFDAWLDTRIEQVCREIKQPETAAALPAVLLIQAPEGQKPADVGQTDAEEPQTEIE